METTVINSTVSAYSGGVITEKYVIKPITPKNKFCYYFIKRSFDIFFSLIGGVILIIPMLIIAAWIKLDSKGPILHKQERLGENGRAFMMYKFRSMYLNAEENGPQWADKIDDRCTGAGNFLRKTRLDELPQLWNIFIGDMSVVGPRPERKYFYDQFETYIYGFRNRLAIRPGLTGWAQVNGGYDLKPEEKILFDMEYIENQSLFLDFKCIIKTVPLVFTYEGAR